MKVVINYRQKIIMIDIKFKKDIFIELDNGFYYTHRNIYLVTKTGRVKIGREEDGYYIFYKHNEVMYRAGYSDTISTERGIYYQLLNSIDVINNNIKNRMDLIIDATSLNTEGMLNIINKINDDYTKLAEKNRIIDENKRIEEEKALAKQKLEDTSIAINKVKNKKSINNDEFELLIKHFNIYVHPKTLGFIRNGLYSIMDGSSISKKNKKSDKIYEIYDNLIDKIKELDNER